MSVATSPASKKSRTNISRVEYYRLAMYLSQYVQEHPKETFNVRTLHELLQGNTQHELKESTVRSIASLTGLKLTRCPMPRKSKWKLRRTQSDFITHMGRSPERDGMLAKALLELTQALGYTFEDKKTTAYLESLVSMTAHLRDPQMTLPGVD